jgi:hypothetical protein
MMQNEKIKETASEREVRERHACISKRPLITGWVSFDERNDRIL